MTAMKNLPPYLLLSLPVFLDSCLLSRHFTELTRGP